MTTHSSDAPTVTLFTNTSTQWYNAIHATLVVSRFRRILSQSAHQQGLGGLEHLQSKVQEQNEPCSELDDTLSQASRNEETNQAATEALDRALEDTNPEIEVLKLIRDELAKQLDAYGLVLVLLAGITFVAILQPPGSFDDGKLQGSLLVSLFMLLATLSFFIACTALGAVMVGCAVLFRPFFHTKLAKYTDVSKSKPTATPARLGVNKTTLLGCFARGPNSSVGIDDIEMLAELCIENVYRIRRIRLYLGAALALCIAAYICGALAVMGASDRQRYLLVGAVAVGGVIVSFESCTNLYAFWSRGLWWCHTCVRDMHHHTVSIDRLQQPTVVAAAEVIPAIQAEVQQQIDMRRAIHTDTTRD